MNPTSGKDRTIRHNLSSLTYNRLHEIDWTFASAHTRGQTHGIHPYPAKFIPQIPREFISSLHPGDGTAVMDPFCGSGTTLVEAALAGIPAVGVDLHPLACLISKVKVTALSRSLSAAAEAAVQRAHQVDSTPPEIPALDHWFRQDVQRALASLIRSIRLESDPDVRDALLVAFSSIVVRVSNQESDTRYAAIEKNVSGEDVWDGFRRAAQTIDRALTATWGGLFSPSTVKVINSDVLLVRPGEVGLPVSLVITSPPYPNAYEYWLYHKYRMYWLGMDPIAVRESEIGARPHYFKRDPHTVDDFERQMLKVFAMLSEVLVQGGHVCFQIGTSVIRGQVVDNASIAIRAARAYGFDLVASMLRDIPTKRKAFHPHHARIREERVLVLRLAKA